MELLNVLRSKQVIIAVNFNFCTFAEKGNLGLFDQVTVQVPNLSQSPCIFKDLVYIRFGSGYDAGKPLIKSYLSGVFGSIKSPKIKKNINFQWIFGSSSEA
jgi:hypothetical protein